MAGSADCGVTMRVTVLRSRLVGTVRGEEGQGLVEYVLILILISLVAVTIMSTVGQSLIPPFQSVANTLGT